MKYHSPFSTIVISVIIVLLFAAVAVFTVLFFGISSPTEVVVKEAISAFSTKDPSLALSYSSIDRRLSVGVTINDVELTLDDKPILVIDEVAVDKGIVSIFKELFSDVSRFQLDIRNPKVSISKDDISRITEIFSSKAQPQTEEDIQDDEIVDTEGKDPRRFILELDFSDLSLEFDDIAKLPEADMVLKFDTLLGLVSAEAHIDNIDVNYNEISGKLDDILLHAARKDEDYALKLSVADISFDCNDIYADLENLVADTSIGTDSFSDPMHIPFRMSATSLEAEKSNEDIYLKSLPFSITSDGSDVVTGFNQIYASYGKYALSLDSLSLGLDLIEEMARLSIDDVIAYQETTVLGRSENIMASIDRSNGAVLDMASISTDHVSALTDGYLSDAVLHDLNLKILPEGSKERAVLNAGLKIGSADELLNGLSTVIEVNGLFSTEDLFEANVVLSEIGNANFAKPVRIAAIYDRNAVTLDVDYGNENIIDIDYRDSIQLLLKLDEFHVSEALPFINVLAPEVGNYIEEDTVLNGRLSLVADEDKDSVLGFTGPIDYAFALSGVKFNTMKFNVGTTLSSVIGKEDVDIRSFILTSDYVKLRYSGLFSLENFLPEGTIGLELSKTGADILSLDLDLNEDSNYVFKLDIPMLGKTTLDGNLDFDGLRFLSNARLTSFSTPYDFLLELDLDERYFNLHNSNATVSVNWENGIDAIASFREFALPVGLDGVEPCTLTGDMKLDFDFQSQKYKAHSTAFHIDNMRHLPMSPSLEFSLGFEDGVLSIYDATFVSSAFEEMYGSASFDFKEKSVAIIFRSASELLQFSATGIGDYYSGLFSATDYNLERLGLDDGIMNLSLVGRGKDMNSLSFSGGFNVRGSDMINKPLEMRGEVYVNKDTLSITDLIYKKNAMTVTCPDILFSTNDGSLTIPLSLNLLKENKDRSYPVSMDLMLSMEMEGQKDFYNLFRELAEDDFETIRFGLKLSNFNLDNKFFIDERYSEFSLKDKALLFDGNFINGRLDMENKAMDLSIDLAPIGSFKLDGTFAPVFDINAEIINFNVAATNFLFIAPVVVFGDSSMANGSVVISGKPGDIHMFGDVWADRVDVNLLWVPDDVLIAHNVHFVIWDNNMKTAMTAVTAVDKHTQERRDATVVCEFNFLPSFSFDYYQIDCYVPDGNEISFRLPLIKQNIDMKGMVSGYYQIRQEGLNDIFMKGTANCDDFIVSIGLDERPHWVEVNPDKRTSFDFNLLLRENFKFVYPLGPNPIISAYAAENQNLRIWTEYGKGFGASGSIGLRAGEIYYFQKNFLITEGNLELRETDMNMIDPLINLRAQLRDFDAEGNKVDIYLVLRDASLTNFNPTFESSPAKDISEIMNILGQSIISTENEGNLNSVVSLVSTGVDVLNRIGYLSMGSQSDSFRKSIRTSLNLDTFSLHTNIIENLVFDAVGLVQNSISRGVSPLASYLDGTSLYMGKYLTTDLYLGAMVHLAADRSGGLDTNRTSFLTTDLSLDTEISIEWENPLCNFRFFTRPSSINAFEIFDTMGFSLTRRFVF